MGYQKSGEIVVLLQLHHPKLLFLTVRPKSYILHNEDDDDLIFGPQSSLFPVEPIRASFLFSGFWKKFME